MPCEYSSKRPPEYLAEKEAREEEEEAWEDTDEDEEYGQ